ncbi:MAG: hypothetical protein NTX27_04975 [Verrucomicrobia bacterium]|jgi:alpha-tubulin suppressor-like RCC1 family protein|nr:hypothetical protein [Verrucomicrobiota bacterium]
MRNNNIICLGFLLVALSNVTAIGQPKGRVILWGRNIGGQDATVPVSWESNCSGVVTFTGIPLTNVIAIAAGASHALALRADGTVVGWGDDSYGQATGRARESSLSTNGVVSVSGHLLAATAIAAGDRFSIALQRDGSVVAWGINEVGQTSLPSGLSKVVAISAGKNHGLALESTGQVIQWGASGFPPPPSLSNVVAIAAGGDRFARNLALTRDGKLITWGGESRFGDATPPPWLSNIVSIAVGEHHSLALTQDGRVTGWGLNADGEATGIPTPDHPNVGRGLVTISGQRLSGVMAVACANRYGMAGIGCGYSLALRRDGSVVAWGQSGWRPAGVPPGLTNVTAIAAGRNFSLALQAEELPEK